MENIYKKIEILKDFYGVRTDKELASKLDVSVHTINTWKQRKKLPSKIELLITQNELKCNTQKKHPFLVEESGVNYNEEYYEFERLNAKLSAGYGIEHYEVEVIEQIPLPKSLFKLPVNPKDIKILEVDGDSMEPTIKNGAYILINITKQGGVDGIYAILLENALLIKRLQFNLDGSIMIISDNDNYKTQIYNPKEHKDIKFKILGQKILCIQ